MNDIISQLSAVHRVVGTVGGPDSGGSVLVRRTFPAAVSDVWDACTTAERIGRWLGAVSGELRLGGRYQLEGHPGGEVVRCEPPRLLRVTWGGSEVEVRLAPGDGDAETAFELEHTGVREMDPALWARFGPGGVGVGWDLALGVGLYVYLSTGRKLPGDPAAWAASPQAREFIARSSEAWGEAFRQAGASDADVASAAAETTAAYAPPLPEPQR